MPKQRNSPMILRILGIGIALIQLFDIIIHVVTNQIKPLRVSSNLIVLLWLAVVTSGRINAKFMQAAVGSIGAYLVLNLIFLALEGVTNPNQGGALRVALFLFVFLTVGLSSWLTYLTNRLKAG